MRQKFARVILIVGNNDAKKFVIHKYKQKNRCLFACMFWQTRKVLLVYSETKF